MPPCPTIQEGHGAEVDDGAAAGRLHVRQHGLGGEELVAQVHSYAVVPVLGGDVLRAVALVMHRVVHQHGDRPHCVAQPGDGGAQLRDVGQVGVGVTDGRPQFFGQGASLRVLDVKEADLRSLDGEAADDGLADPGRAAGDEHGFAGQVWVNCCHGMRSFVDG